MSSLSASTKPKSKKPAPKKKAVAKRPVKKPAAKSPAKEKLVHLKKILHPQLRQMVLLIGLAAVSVAIILASGSTNQQLANQQAQNLNQAALATDRATLRKELEPVLSQITQLEASEVKEDIQVADTTTLKASTKAIQTEIENNRFAAASSDLKTLKTKLKAYQTTLSQKVTQKQVAAQKAPLAPATPAALPRGEADVPILLYHDPPSDFAQQLLYLQAHHYTTITPDELVGGLRGSYALPAKPVLITFDDGLETQMGAFNLLEKYHMLATFYIIDGGQDSGYHIGANRIVPDPQGGPDYLTWDQIRMLDTSGIITIGSHTIDHLDLASQDAGTQQVQIFEGKSELEAEIGHSVDSFAYPYGSYNSTTLSLVTQAGFTSAVTTNPGIIQSINGLLTLYRIRTVYDLP